jgi:serine protease
MALATLASGCSDRAPGETQPIARDTAALSAVTQKFTLTLPSSTESGALALAAGNGLQVGDRARVTATSGFAALSNGGSTVTTLGVESQVGTTRSVGSLVLRDRARVNGDASAGGAITLGNGAAITGVAVANTPVPLDRVSWTVNLPQSGSPVTVPPDGSASSAPGSYAAVLVNSRATLSLRAGTYYMDSLTVEPQARLSVNTQDGPVVVYVRQGLTFRGTTAFTGPNDRLLIAYSGTLAPALDKSFDGTLVAPNASVRLGIGGSPYTGAVHAASILVDPDVRFVHRPFARWDTLSYDVLPTLKCVNRRSDGTYAAVLGYYNPNGSPRTAVVGTANRFVPNPENHGQPTTFLPGRFPAAFTIDFGSATSLTWQLTGNAVTVPRTGTACPASMTVGNFEDATVALATPNENFGASDRLRVAPGSHALVSFDRAAVKRQLGPGLYIARATLELSRAAGSSPAVEAFRMYRPFRESSATWSCGNDTDSSPTGVSCAPGTEWSLERDDVAESNPWSERHAGRRVLGTWSSEVVRFDVTRDVQDLLGADGVKRGMAWALVLTAAETASVELRSSEALNGPRLVLDLGTRPEVGPSGSQPPLSFSVDTSVIPGRADLAPLPNGTPRVASAVRDAGGTVATFVERELVFWPATDAELTAILARWNGVVVKDRTTPPELPHLARRVTVRIDPARAQNDALRARVLELDNRPRGAHSFSSSAALSTMAAAAEEAVAGRKVGINWVLQPQLPLHDWVARDIVEGDDQARLQFVTTAGKNPFHWPGFADCDPDPASPDVPPPCRQSFPDGTPIYQHLNVAEGWRALAMMDKLNAGSVRAALIDRWFGMDTDYPSALTVRDLSGIGNETPGHGHLMTLAGFAVPGNGIGAAGPGGPVVDLTQMRATYEESEVGDAFEWSYRLEQRIAAASMTMTIPYYLTPFMWMDTARADDMAIFASAGNDGRNVDAEDCFLTIPVIGVPIPGCNESVSVEPCENEGVICVGGLGWDSALRHPGSNYGESVNIGAPWHTFIHAPNANGPDGLPLPDRFTLLTSTGAVPTMPVTLATLASPNFGGGTSGASAFAAGLGALIFAANPDLTTKQMKYCLYSSALSPNTNDFPAMPDAVRAIRCAVGGSPNSPLPGFLRIEQPLDGAAFGVGEPANVLAVSADFDGDVEPAIAWSSNIDGALAVTSSGVSGSLTFSTTGDHVLTASITTANGPYQDSVTVHVGCSSERACGSVCCSGLQAYCMDPSTGACCTEYRDECGSQCCPSSDVCSGGACVPAGPQDPSPAEFCRDHGYGPPCSVLADCPSSASSCSHGCCIILE